MCIVVTYTHCLSTPKTIPIAALYQLNLVAVHLVQDSPIGGMGSQASLAVSLLITELNERNRACSGG